MGQIRKKSLSDAVLEEIKRMIRNNDIREGDKLPNQNDLAAQMGVSRTSLREAFSKLSFLGAVEQKPGAGTILVSKLSALKADTVAPPLMSDAKAASELNDAREVLEIGSASFAAKNATEQQIQEIGQLIGEMEKALKFGDIQKYIELDIAFHLHIAKSTNNRFIIYSYKNMQGYIEQYIQECMNVIPKMQKTSMQFHIRIYKALKTRDPENAANTMRNHINDIRKNYKKFCELSIKTLTQE